MPQVVSFGATIQVYEWPPEVFIPCDRLQILFQLKMDAAGFYETSLTFVLTGLYVVALFCVNIIALRIMFVEIFMS
jgi:hypothetical protein